MKAKVSFNTPKAGKITVDLDGSKAILTLDEYMELLPESKRTTSEEYFKMLKVNIKNYLLSKKKC